MWLISGIWCAKKNGQKLKLPKQKFLSSISSVQKSLQQRLHPPVKNIKQRKRNSNQRSMQENRCKAEDSCEGKDTKIGNKIRVNCTEAETESNNVQYVYSRNKHKAALIE